MYEYQFDGFLDDNKFVEIVNNVLKRRKKTKEVFELISLTEHNKRGVRFLRSEKRLAAYIKRIT